MARPPSTGSCSGSAIYWNHRDPIFADARMEIDRVETNVLRQRIRRGEFQAAFGRLFMGWVFEERRRNRWWGADGWTGYVNPGVAAKFDSLVELTDPDEVDRVLRELAPILREEVPVTILFPQVQTVVAHRRVRGLRSPYLSDPAMHAEHLDRRGGALMRLRVLAGAARWE